MNGEERFVQAATRGLGRRARQAAQAELRSHLHERARQLMLEGHAEAEARAQAMRELGPAPAIRRSLWGAHPPLHLLWWAGAVLVACWAVWGLRDVQRTDGPFIDPDPYGQISVGDGRWEGWPLDRWASRLPPEAQISTDGGAPVLVLNRTQRVPLTGGSTGDRPLKFVVEGFGWLDKLVVQESYGTYRALIPALQRYRHVRGPYLSLWALSQRAYRLGLTVEITRQRDFPVAIAGVPLPAEPMAATLDWSDNLERELLGHQLQDVVAGVGSSSVFPLRFSDAGLDVLRVQPRATYRLVLRYRQDVMTPSGVEFQPTTVFSPPLTADFQGVLRLTSIIAPVPGVQQVARLFGDLQSWASAPLDAEALPSVLIEVTPTLNKNSPATVWADTVRLGRPLELALAQP